MAKVWFVREGPDPTSGEPEYTLPLKQCIDQLGLDRNQWFSSLDRPPRFDDPGPTWPREYRHVFCEVDEREAAEHGWDAGFYRRKISPKEVAKRLGPTGVG